MSKQRELIPGWTAEQIRNVAEVRRKALGPDGRCFAGDDKLIAALARMLDAYEADKEQGTAFGNDQAAEEARSALLAALGEHDSKMASATEGAYGRAARGATASWPIVPHTTNPR